MRGTTLEAAMLLLVRDGSTDRKAATKKLMKLGDLERERDRLMSHRRRTLNAFCRGENDGTLLDELDERLRLLEAKIQRGIEAITNPETTQPDAAASNTHDDE